MAAMKAIVATALNGPEGLQLQEVPDPTPGPKEVLVRVEAVGVNFADALASAGKYPGGPKAPFITGREFAGILESTGERVMGYAQQGACAEKIAAHPRMIWPAPANWNAIQAAAFPVNFLTAWLLYWKAGLIPNTTPSDPSPIDARRPRRVLIHAAAGGVGTAAVQIGRLLGIETFGTASTVEKLERVKQLGLNHPINYANEDYEQRVQEITLGQGVDAVFDALGGEHTAKSLRCCGFLGRVILFGTASGERPKFDTFAMYNNSASAHGLWLSRLATHFPLIAQALDSMKPWIESGELRPVIGAKFPLEAAAEAHRLLLGRKNFGKIVLTVNS
ncbi:MAG TPA: NADPH:quinone oxidoreductase family protein [Clostridia bacterium]|nr:NADPH:quinone oxidoreductase family protein [Clostridia bacterium]